MELVIFLAWFCLVCGISLALIVSGYRIHVEGAKTIDIVAKLTFGFIVHSVLTVTMFPLMFIMIFAGAHTVPVGNALTVAGKIFYVCAIALHAFAGWLLCSFVNGRLIGLRSIIGIGSEEPISILR